MVCVLLFAAALATALIGIGLRTVVGRNREVPAVRRTVRFLRGNVIGRILFGRAQSDALDADELDGMILVPAIVLSCGLFLTGVFLLGYQVLA
jgi:hypothetical protein